MKELKELKLTTKKRSKITERCPCGGSNKDGKFVPYEMEGEILPNYGYCHSCGDDIRPPLSERFANESKKSNQRKPLFLPPKPAKPVLFVDASVPASTFKAYSSNNFALWLCGLFGNDTGMAAMARYNVGTAKEGKTVFWYQNRSGQYMTAKLMKYNRTGKRDKAATIFTKYKKSEGYGACFFGEHLLKEGTNVGIVESEKTAIILSIIKPEIVWLASSGATGITDEKAKALSGFNVFLFPDCDKAGRENYEKAAIRIGAKVIDVATNETEGTDLCDIFLKEVEKLSFSGYSGQNKANFDAYSAQKTGFTADSEQTSDQEQNPFFFRPLRRGDNPEPEEPPF